MSCPLPDLAGSSDVCFPLQRGDRFGQGQQQSLFSPPGSLGQRGGETQDWFYPLPGNSKASRRSCCQRGETVWQRGCREMGASDQLIEKHKKIKNAQVGVFIFQLEFGEHEREDNSTVKSTCSSRRICWCPLRSVYSACPRWPPPEDAGSCANTQHTWNEHIIWGTFLSRHGYRKSTGTCWNHLTGLIFWQNPYLYMNKLIKLKQHSWKTKENLCCMRNVWPLNQI